MSIISPSPSTLALAPLALMMVIALLTRWRWLSVPQLWRLFQALSGAALIAAGLCVWLGTSYLQLPAPLQVSPLGLVLAGLVQLLGTVIVGFSARYLDGEPGQRRYLTALASVLTAVHALLIADHWLVLIAAWVCVGAALQPLLCFYPDRPFAQLAAHKKRIADRLADGLLIGAAGLAWAAVGSGSLSALSAHISREGLSPALQLSAIALVMAVVLRSALLPVHGWLIQVMEAPTPVSALMHAGVVNLGGFVLIRFAPLLEHALPARALLLAFGVTTTVLAGMVMLTRVSIKVRLAWSTVAQMGFMLVECALGLYTLAALHLIGHSLYKAHAFLSAATIVRQARLRALRSPSPPSALNMLLAPVASISIVLPIQLVVSPGAWPWWWSAVLGLAWAPLLWLSAAADRALRVRQALFGLLLVTALTGATLLVHAWPLGLDDAPPRLALGLTALISLAALYSFLAILQWRPTALSQWRRWSYAGFYLDETYTRIALRLWPTRWAPAPFDDTGRQTATALPTPAR